MCGLLWILYSKMSWEQPVNISVCLICHNTTDENMVSLSLLLNKWWPCLAFDLGPVFNFGPHRDWIWQPCLNQGKGEYGVMAIIKKAVNVTGRWERLIQAKKTKKTTSTHNKHLVSFQVQLKSLWLCLDNTNKMTQQKQPKNTPFCDVLHLLQSMSL